LVPKQTTKLHVLSSLEWFLGPRSFGRHAGISRYLVVARNENVHFVLGWLDAQAYQQQNCVYLEIIQSFVYLIQSNQLKAYLISTKILLLPVRNI